MTIFLSSSSTFSTIDFSKRYFMYTRVIAMAFPIILLRFANLIHTSIFQFDTYFHSLKSRMQERSAAKQARCLIDRKFRSRRRGRPRAALRKPLPAALLGRCATPSKTDRSVTRCLKMHHNYRGSPLAARPRPRFLARVEYEAALAFPVSGTNVSIYGCRLPAPTSYDIVSAGSQNLRDRWLG